ncbi:MAG: hypothetical protein ACRD1Q_10135 [Vicinamibacterales bacterium]
MGRRALLLLAAAFVTTVATACENSTDPAGSFVVTGHIENRTQSPIPANARLLAVWVVTAGSPDYSYVFGEGSINPLLGTFRILFDQPPPIKALNRGALGVAVILATTDQSLQVGDSIGNSYPVTEIIGVTGQYAVIFVQNRDTLTAPTWVDAFDDGYSVGVGVKALPTEVFDKFAPTSRSSPVLIIDDLANIEIVNWT